jgi:hypothetical protein
MQKSSVMHAEGESGGWGTTRAIHYRSQNSLQAQTSARICTLQGSKCPAYSALSQHNTTETQPMTHPGQESEWRQKGVLGGVLREVYKGMRSTRGY